MGNDKLKKVSVLSREEYIRQLAASMEPLDICLTNDYAFRRIFKNKIVAKGFLMALLEVYSSKFLFHVIELKKLEETSEEEKKQELYRWARMIAARSWEEVCMEAKGNPYMEAAKDVMDKINQSETERYLYLRQEMAITDEKSRLMTAERKGREEGEILKLISLVQKKCLRGKALEVVSEELEEDPENIREIYKAASEHLENSPEDILEILKRG